jgi:hypothetical protein
MPSGKSRRKGQERPVVRDLSPPCRSDILQILRREHSTIKMAILVEWLDDHAPSTPETVGRLMDPQTFFSDLKKMDRPDPEPIFHSDALRQNYREMLSALRAEQVVRDAVRRAARLPDPWSHVLNDADLNKYRALRERLMATRPTDAPPAGPADHTARLLDRHPLSRSKWWCAHADQFLERMNACALQAASELAHERLRVRKKADLLAECRSLSRKLSSLGRKLRLHKPSGSRQQERRLSLALADARQRLREISVDLDRELGAHPTAIECEEALSFEGPIGDVRPIRQAIAKMLNSLRRGERRIETERPRSMRTDEARRRIAEDLVRSVQPVFDAYHVTLSGSGTSDAAAVREAHYSSGVQILHALGNEIGLRYALVTWRDFTATVLKEAP